MSDPSTPLGDRGGLGASRSRPVRVANCSGFFGDRLAAAAEMVRGGPIDVLTGDWLAELTMLILARQRMKHGPGSGYARTFLAQLRDVLGDCAERGIKIVTNAGGLDPEGLADQVREVAAAAGVAVRVGVVTGDDISGALPDLMTAGERFVNRDTGEAFAELGVPALTANAYLGGLPITEALHAGADIVVCGRVTDAALAIGPAAWWHGWSYDADHVDRLAGALVAGHVIECGAQATGGNYSFFRDVPGLEHVGFPIAEIADSGAAVITKHPGTGGLVSVGTVTAQLLYELGDPLYLNPDVSADFRSIRLDQVGRDRVLISGVKGGAPPSRLKVSLNYLGGFRNTMTLVLTGLEIEAKADLALRTITGVGLAEAQALSGAELAAKSTLAVAELDVELVRGDSDDPRRIADAQAHLRISVKDADPNRVGKDFTAPAVESALATYPGMFPTAPPAPGTPFGVFWPTDVSRGAARIQVAVDGADPLDVSPAGWFELPLEAGPADDVPCWSPGTDDAVSVPLGWVAGARSGDKGGNANIGVWVPDPVEAEAVGLAAGEIDSLVAPEPRSGDDIAELWRVDSSIDCDEQADARADDAYRWLCDLLGTPERVHELLPDTAGLRIDIHPLPSLRAVNLVVHGLLGRGVNENTLLDPQAKGLGELLRARIVAVPTSVLDREDPPLATEGTP